MPSAFASANDMELSGAECSVSVFKVKAALIKPSF